MKSGGIPHISIVCLLMILVHTDGLDASNGSPSATEAEGGDITPGQGYGQLGPGDPHGLTALDSYVAAPDASYTWSRVREINTQRYAAYVLDMTSQTWLTSDEVDRTQWRHWVTVIVPKTVSSTTAFLWIGAGNNWESSPTAVDTNLAMIATATSTVVAEVRMIPNQPLTFAGDVPRWEDALIAYCWDKFLTTGEDIWVTRLPMTKAVVRAMDAVEELCKSLSDGPLTIKNFVVGGMSKRGWTTWTTAAVDARVVGIAPVVIDVLNVERSMSYHWAAYGFWAEAVRDYEDMNIMDRFDTPELEALMAITDPYSYRTRYIMPKFIINSAGDDFFLPDSSQFYFDDLPGEKHLRYVPNTDHSLGGSDMWHSLLAWYESVVNGVDRPQFSWTLLGDGLIHVQTVDAPGEVRLWQATNLWARDFRRNAYPAQGHSASTPVWHSSPLIDQGDGLYIAEVNMPPAGWTAFFVELAYDNGGTRPWKFTTEVGVTPYHLPFACDFDRDTDIDLADLYHFASQWLETGGSAADVVPRGGDEMVNFRDFVTLGRNWSAPPERPATSPPPPRR
jgi:PhoPQ-activated pathogenicity-related protein